jgi:hypothetical protein
LALKLLSSHVLRYTKSGDGDRENGISEVLGTLTDPKWDLGMNSGEEKTWRNGGI